MPSVVGGTPASSSETCCGYVYYPDGCCYSKYVSAGSSTTCSFNYDPSSTSTAGLVADDAYGVPTCTVGQMGSNIGVTDREDVQCFISQAQCCDRCTGILGSQRYFPSAVNDTSPAVNDTSPAPPSLGPAPSNRPTEPTEPTDRTDPSGMIAVTRVSTQFSVAGDIGSWMPSATSAFRLSLLMQLQATTTGVRDVEVTARAGSVVLDVVILTNNAGSAQVVDTLLTTTTPTQMSAAWFSGSITVESVAPPTRTTVYISATDTSTSCDIQAEVAQRCAGVSTIGAVVTVILILFTLPYIILHACLLSKAAAIEKLAQPVTFSGIETMPASATAETPTPMAVAVAMPMQQSKV